MKKTKIACIGDSLTYGYLVENREENCYPAQLQKRLGAGYEVRNFGENGATMSKEGDNPYWSHPKFQESSDFEPYIVLIMLGTNDSKSHNWKSVEHYMATYKEMIYHYKALPSRPKIYLLTPPKVFTLPLHHVFSNIREDFVDIMADAVRKLGTELDLPVIEVNLATANRSECFPEDGIHTNALGARLIADTVHEAL